MRPPRLEAAPPRLKAPSGVAPRVLRASGALLAVASAVSYGALGVLTKVAYAEGWNVPSLLSARFLLASLVILPFALRAPGGWRGFGGGLLLGAVGYVATTALYFPSLRLLPAAVASFLLFLAPALVALLSWAFLGERLGARGLGGLGLSLAGLLLLSSGAFTGALSVPGVLLAAGSAVAYAVAVLGSRRLVRGLHWTRSSLAVCVGAFLSYATFSTATGALEVPATQTAVLAALGIGTVATGLAMSLFFAALPRIGASRTAVISTLEPVSTLLLAALFLAEVPGWTGVAGGALIMGGAALAAAERAEEITAAPPE